MKVRIGTRGSDLALWQANHVKERLEAVGCEVELVVLKTRGDRIDDVPLQQVEGKAFFTAEIEAALFEGSVDLAVHSHKDLPVEGPPGLEIAAIPERANPAERLLVARTMHDPAAPFLPLRLGSTVGTSAPRRAEQLVALRPDLTVASLRGNVPTRVRRLQEGRYDAIVLAAAGLERLGLDTSGLVDVELATDLLVPSPAQGALAVQARGADEELVALVRRTLHDSTTAEAVGAERTLLVEAGGGCNLPLGCNVVPHAGRWRARAFLGPDTPVAGSGARWTEVVAEEPAHAVRRAYERLTAGSPTGHGPLAGRRIAITGASAGPTRLGARLEVLGAEVRHEEVLAFRDVAGPPPADRIAELGPGDGVVVTSKEAARRLAGVHVPHGVLVGAVGPGTAAALRASGHEVDHVGDGGAGELARSLPVASGRRVLFPCAEDALDELERGLSARDVAVERLPLYRTDPVSEPDLGADVIARVYMSPSAVVACLEQERALGEAAPRRFALGRTTAAALEEHGLAFQAPSWRAARSSLTESVVHLLAATTSLEEALS